MLRRKVPEPNCAINSGCYHEDRERTVGWVQEIVERQDGTGVTEEGTN